MLQQMTSWAKLIKRDVIALWLAARDPRTPWYAKLLALCIAGYALSPIDLIPDFIPLLGYLDEIVLLPLGILATVALIPSALMAEFRSKADELSARPQSRIAAAMIVLVWISVVAVIGWYIYSRYRF